MELQKTYLRNVLLFMTLFEVPPPDPIPREDKENAKSVLLKALQYIFDGLNSVSWLFKLIKHDRCKNFKF